MENKRNNIILIGMPGAGKSVLGKELAKKMSMKFLDIDEYIQIRENKKLQEIINEVGDDGFAETEKNRVLELDLSNYIVATGGSVVLKEETINHLKNLGLVVYLDVPLEILQKRLGNLDIRGVVGLASGLSLKEIFDLRTPLYRKYADLTTCVSDNSLNKTINLIINKLKVL